MLDTTQDVQSWGSVDKFSFRSDLRKSRKRSPIWTNLFEQFIWLIYFNSSIPVPEWPDKFCFLWEWCDCGWVDDSVDGWGYFIESHSLTFSSLIPLALKKFSKLQRFLSLIKGTITPLVFDKINGIIYEKKKIFSLNYKISHILTLLSKVKEQ
jgi:hypothetical protein